MQTVEQAANMFNERTNRVAPLIEDGNARDAAVAAYSIASMSGMLSLTIMEQMRANQAALLDELQKVRTELQELKEPQGPSGFQAV